MRHQIARAIFWLGWSRVLVQLVSFLSTLIVARLLSPADYGLMALATIWTATLGLVAELGLGPTIIQFPDLDAGELNICFWLTVGLASMTYAALWAAAPAIASWFATPKLSAVLRLVGLTLPLVALRLVPEGLLRKRLEFDKVSQAEMAGVLVTLPTVLGLAWRGWGVWALVVGALAMPLGQMVVVFFCVRWWPGVRLRSQRLGSLIRYGLGSLGARASWAAYEQVDTLVLGRVAGGLILGFYSMAKTLAILPVVKISVVVNQLAQPVMAGLQGDRSALRASFLRALRFVACFTVPICIGAALVADDLVGLALGAKWQPIVPLLRVLCVFGMIRSLDALLPPVLFARYRPAFLFWWTVALLLIMPFAFWAGAIRMGAVGVALAWVLVYPLMMSWMAREALREMATEWRTLWTCLRPFAVAVLMMAAGVLAVHGTIRGVETVDRVTRLGLSVVVATALYGVGILWRGRHIVGEIAEVVGWLVSRPRTAPTVSAPVP